MDTGILDGHVHIHDETQIEEFGRIEKSLGLSGMGLVCTACSSGGHDNAIGFLAKHRRHESEGTRLRGGRRRV